MKKGQRNFWIILGVVVIVILMIILIILSKPNKVDKPNKVEPGILYIGPLTGQLAGTIGIPHMNGLKVAESDFSYDSIFYEDDQGDPKNSISILNNYLSMGTIKFVISPLSGVSFALAPIVNQSNIILMSTAANPKISLSNENVFRLFIKASNEGLLLANLAKEMGIKNISIIYENSDFGISEKEGFITHFKEAGINIVTIESFKPGDVDMKTQIDKILVQNPEGIVIGGAGTKDLGVIFKQIKEKGYTGKLFGGLNTGYLHFIGLKDLTEGLYFTDFDFDAHDTKYSNFVNKYKQLFGEQEVLANSAIEYALIEIIIQASEGCNDNVECIKENLNSKKFNTIFGVLKFDSERNSELPMSLKVVQDGKNKPLL